MSINVDYARNPYKSFRLSGAFPYPSEGKHQRPKTMTRISVLDFVRITEATNPRIALDNARDVALHAEKWGYTRYWVAEHHNYPGIVGGPTAVVLAHVGAGTSTIRIGAGGVMMPNHAPIIVAEQYGALAHLYPGRVDLGIGRASGSEQKTVRALRRPLGYDGDLVPDVVELQQYFSDTGMVGEVQAIPARGMKVPLWILGSSLYGARIAAEMGLPYAFASHFAPDALLDALTHYRKYFRPSPFLARPQTIIGVSIVAGETDRDAVRLATTQQMTYADLIRGKPGMNKPPIDDINTYWSDMERAHAERMLTYSIVGSKDTVREQIEALVGLTGADELIIDSNLFDHDERLRSFQIIAEAVGVTRQSGSVSDDLSTTSARPSTARA
jgi:luciferase family oxidoreductase group 1